MIFPDKSIFDLHDDLELRGYISSNSDTESGCHSILSYSEEMTDSDRFDQSLESQQTPDNMTVEDFHSQQYYNEIGAVHRTQQNLDQSMQSYQSDVLVNRYNQDINFSRETSPTKNSYRSCGPPSSSYDGNIYATYPDESNLPLQASPDSQNSYYAFNSEGKYSVNVIIFVE